MLLDWLALEAPTSQNGQIHSNNSLAIAGKCVFDHFVGLAIKGLNLVSPFSPFRVMFLFYVPSQK